MDNAEVAAAFASLPESGRSYLMDLMDTQDLVRAQSFDSALRTEKEQARTQELQDYYLKQAISSNAEYGLSLPTNLSSSLANGTYSSSTTPTTAGSTTPAPTGGFRTDRHNNPTAFTSDIAKQAGLVEGVDYTVGDKFPDSNLTTARLLKDPIDTTIKVIDSIGFYTQSGQPRWTHTAMSETEWNKLSYDQKSQVIKNMYQKEGGSGSVFNSTAGTTTSAGGSSANQYQDLYNQLSAPLNWLKDSSDDELLMEALKLGLTVTK